MNAHIAKQVVLLTGLILGFGLETASAYIPSSRTIAGRLARNSGKGIYAIDQEVQFKTEAEPVTIRETWLVENGESMRLIAAEPKPPKTVAKTAVTTPPPKTETYRFDAVYHDGKRTASDLRGGQRTTPVSAEFIEGFSHARSTKGFLDAILRAGLVPGSFARERQRFSPTTKAYQPEPLVRLGRSGTVVNYVFGEPTPINARSLNPGVWIEQDAFVLRRLRFPTEAELIADQPSLYAGGLKLARVRQVNWAGGSATIRVLSVKSVDAGQAARLLNPSSIGANESRNAKLPELTQVKEFYSRFR